MPAAGGVVWAVRCAPVSILAATLSAAVRLTRRFWPRKELWAT